MALNEWGAVQGAVLEGYTKLSSSLCGIDSLEALQAWFTQAAGIGAYPNPLVTVLATAVLAAVFALVTSWVTGNASIVDKTWSILPAYYAWVFVLHSVRASGWEVHPRLALITALCTVWGVRLSYNFWRKGGYGLHGEDYRWPIIRAHLHPVLFQIFNITFIAFYQNILLASLLSPVYVVWQTAYDRHGKLQAPLNEIDALAFAVAAGLLIMEAVADQQQWVFQGAKHAALAARKRLTGPLAQGFISTGLWRYSRHPNFFAEQAFWWSLSLFATAATGRWGGWWLAGAAQLTLLFQGSTILTERITAAKYPKYKDYQRTTSRLVPWFPSAAAPPAKRAKRASVPPAEAAPAAPVVEVKKPASKASSRGRSPARKSVDVPAPAPAPAARPRSKSTGKTAAPRRAAAKAAAPAAAAPAPALRRSTRSRA